jgi:hypothetical protein
MVAQLSTKEQLRSSQCRAMLDFLLVKGGGVAVLMVAILYFAWLISWGGTFATTCPMGDYKSLRAAMVMSSAFYIGTLTVLPRLRLNFTGMILSLPLAMLMSWQAIWAVKLFLVLSVDGRSACSLMFGGDYGLARGGWFDLILPPYYFLVSLGALAALAASHWRHLRARKAPTKANVFD